MEKRLNLPLSETDVKNLELGDIVYLSGEIVQLLGPAHRRANEYKKEGKQLPFDVKDMAIYHCYTCLSDTGDGGHHCEFLGASTSAGVNPYEPEFIRNFGVRVVIGKGGMDQATLDAMEEAGCVYLAQIGGCCQLCTKAVEQTTEIFWEDMAANLGVKMIFRDLGPLVCSMDAKGNSLFAQVNEKVQANKVRLMEQIGQ